MARPLPTSDQSRLSDVRRRKQAPRRRPPGLFKRGGRQQMPLQTTGLFDQPASGAIGTAQQKYRSSPLSTPKRSFSARISSRAMARIFLEAAARLSPGGCGHIILKGRARYPPPRILQYPNSRSSGFEVGASDAWFEWWHTICHAQPCDSFFRWEHSCRF